MSVIGDLVNFVINMQNSLIHINAKVVTFFVIANKMN